MEQQKPQIPSLKDSQKPQVKIKGLQAGMSLIDRLKQFKKKDLMFISAGLGVLFMAPLAEHLLMAPEQGKNGALTQGWSFGDKDSGFGSSVSPYENGINGLAPGGVTGGGDIITPLNVRDPSALVMGPGAQQQAPATNTTPAPPPPSSEKTPDWKDALSASATTAAKEATKRAALPVPKPALTNAGLRGLGAVAGGGGGSYAAGPISSSGLASNKAEQRGFNRVQAAPDYRGAAGARGAQSGSSGSFENLKKAAGGMTDTLNRSGPASSALEQAANSGMGGGAGSGIGSGGHGGDEKGPSGSQSKDSMNVGESLEFMRQKMEQEKALDLKWKLKEADAMLWPELRKDILKTLVTKPLEGLAGDIGKSFGAWGGDKSKAGSYVCKGQKVPSSKVGKCYSTGDDAKPYGLFYNEGDKNIYSDPQCKPPAAYYDCTPDSGAAGAGGKTKPAVSDLSGVGSGIFDEDNGAGKSLGEVCADLEKLSKDAQAKPDDKALAAALLSAGKGTVEAGQGLFGGSPSQCGAKSMAGAQKNLTALVDKADQRLSTKVGYHMYGAVYDSVLALAPFAKGEKDGGEATKQSKAMKDILEKKTDASKGEAEKISATLFDEKLAQAKKMINDGVDGYKGVQESLETAEENIKGVQSEDIKALEDLNTKVKKSLDDAATQIGEAKKKLEAIAKDTNPELLATRKKWISDIETKHGKFQAYRLETDEFIDRIKGKRDSFEKELPKVKEAVSEAKKLLGFEGQAKDSVSALQKLGKDTIKSDKMPTSLDKSEHGCARQEGSGQFECKQGEETFQDDKKDEPYGREGGKLIGDFEKQAQTVEGAASTYVEAKRKYRENLNKSPGGPSAKGSKGGSPWETSSLQYYKKGETSGVDIWEYVDLSEKNNKKVGPGGKTATPEVSTSAASVEGDGTKALTTHNHTAE